jgi:tripartite-type tricarboxylate transporter receptor subunit TctC
MTSRTTGLALAAGLLLAATTAQAADDFYKGKQIQLLVGTDAGSAYDTYARVMAPHWARHIPGQPTIVPQNMVGAAGLMAAAYLVAKAPTDGTFLFAAVNNLPTAPLLSPDAANYDVTKLSWIGSITKDPYVGYVWETAPVKKIEDAKTTELILGGSAVGSTSIDMAILARDQLGFKFKIVTGYKGSADTKLAMERGEIHGIFGNTWSALKSETPEWIAQKKVRILVQHGFNRHPELPDVPLFLDLPMDPEVHQGLELYLSRQEFGKPYVGPAGVPAERLGILRKAFDETMKDPAFLADAAKARLTIDQPMGGEELAALVKRVSATSPAAVKRIEGSFSRFKAGNK